VAPHFPCFVCFRLLRSFTYHRSVPRIRFALVMLLCASCDEDARECLPGDFQPCTCDAGGEGFAKCSDEGDAYGDCVCEGDPVGGGNGEGGGGALLPFMSECEEDEECDTGVCHDFNAKGPHCSHACEMDTDCEQPSPGCNMMGICKAP
jgi:hypothetical protein